MGKAYNKSAKSTGGYGDLDENLLLTVPEKLKKAIGRAASLTERSAQAFIRQAILEKMVRLEQLLKAHGVQTPTSTQLVHHLDTLREDPKWIVNFLELQKVIKLEDASAALVHILERLEALENRERQRMVLEASVALSSAKELSKETTGTELG